jgi:hypothetical protein
MDIILSVIYFIILLNYFSTSYYEVIVNIPFHVAEFIICLYEN